MLNNKFSKGVIFSCIAAIFWGLPQPLFFNELNHVETIEVVAHRGFWSFIFLFLLLILISNISDFIKIFKSRKRIFILTITAFLLQVTGEVLFILWDKKEFRMHQWVTLLLL